MDRRQYNAEQIGFLEQMDEFGQKINSVSAGYDVDVVAAVYVALGLSARKLLKKMPEGAFALELATCFQKEMENQRESWTRNKGALSDFEAKLKEII